MNLLLLGLSHHTAGLELRERFAVEDAGAVLGKLMAAPDVDEAVVVSTCNRVEVLALTRSLPAARLRLRHFFAAELGGGAPIAPRELDEALYTHEDRAAVRHVFRVASSVDSLVVGEPQILGQVKDAYRAAVASGACGPVLGRLYQRAFATAKRVRNETRIAERPVSVARVGVDLARQIFESLEDKSALLIGAGDMIELALEALHAQGLAAVRVANRTRERAAQLAARFQAEAFSLDALPELIPDSDVVLTSIGGSHPILTESLVQQALRARRGRPIFVIDLGVPRNVEPAVDRLDQVYRYDLDDLSQVAATNAEERRLEVERAEGIVAEEEQRFDGWLAALSAVPTIKNLRTRAERIRRAELERHLARLDLGPEQSEQVEALTRAIVNKLLHAPLSRLRAEVEREQGLAVLEAARALFALDDPEAPGAPSPDDADAPGSLGDADDADAPGSLGDADDADAPGSLGDAETADEPEER